MLSYIKEKSKEDENMTKQELLDKIDEIKQRKSETQMEELKAAEHGCPKRLYDTLSSFSNQDDGGIIIFGIDEENDYNACGVYDPQDIQKKINEQCLQMEPVVRPVLTVAEKDNKYFVAAEIPGIDVTERPCHYKGKGILKGSYIRVGDSDEPMTEYEIYSYEAYRKKIQDDVRVIPETGLSMLDPDLLNEYIKLVKKDKPNLSSLPLDTIYKLMNITKNDGVTLSSLMLFFRYPQSIFPQLCITAVVVPGEEVGEIGGNGERFIDNKRIEGTIPEMLEGALSFVKKNLKTYTIINPATGKRMDQMEYPMVAVREAILNALVHRDYSIHTEGMPIQIIIYSNRLEIISPGGIYGRISVDQLGKIQPSTRNPVIALAMELMQLTENRYSGIPTMIRTMREYGLSNPVFEDRRGSFVVTLYNNTAKSVEDEVNGLSGKEKELLVYLGIPRSRQEIADFLKIGTIDYAIQTYIKPLIERGLVEYTIPQQPRSQKQKFVATSFKERGPVICN